MSRKIEFKALKDDMSNCNFVFGQLVYDAVGTPRITDIDSSGKGLTFHSCLKNTECQFTGVLDKNEKRIFENDIVKVKVEDGVYVKDYLGVINFFEGSFFIEKEDKPFGRSKTPLFSKSHFIEIIGNVFQNPELLEGVC